MFRVPLNNNPTLPARPAAVPVSRPLTIDRRVNVHTSNGHSGAKALHGQCTCTFAVANISYILAISI